MKNKYPASGYNYQCLVTVWVSLELLLKYQLAKINIEPDSHEDIEAVIGKENQDLTLEIDADFINQKRLIVQIKSSKVHWTSTKLNHIFCHTNSSKGKKVNKTRKSPLFLLKDDERAHYIFITNNTFSNELFPLQGNNLFDFKENSMLPKKIDFNLSEREKQNIASRILLLPGMHRDYTLSLIKNLIETYGHILSTKVDESIHSLVSLVFDKMSGKCNGELSHQELVELIKKNGGHIGPLKGSEQYESPNSIDRIERKLNDFNAVILTGPPGIGKTETAHYLETEIRKKNPPVEVIDKDVTPHIIIREMLNSGNHLFILSDPWGSTKLSEDSEQWNSELPKILPNANSKNKIIITTRLDILNAANSSNLNILKKYIVELGEDDYGKIKLKNILDKIMKLSKINSHVLNNSHLNQVLEKLSRPYEIQRFVIGLEEFMRSRKNNDKVSDSNIDELIKNSQIDVISSVVENQLKSLGNTKVKGASILWALLGSRQLLEKEYILSLQRSLAKIDKSQYYEIDELLSYFISGKNFRKDRNDKISYYHPMVENGVYNSFCDRKIEIELVISSMFNALIKNDHYNKGWRLNTLLLILKFNKKYAKLNFNIESYTQKHLDNFLTDRVINPNPNFDCYSTFCDFCEFGSSDNKYRKLVAILLDTDRSKQTYGFDYWKVPNIQTKFIKQFNENSHAQTIIYRFVNEILPYMESIRYGNEITALIRDIHPNADDIYWNSLNAVTDTLGSTWNIDPIVYGVCGTKNSNFDRAIEIVSNNRKHVERWHEEEHLKDIKNIVDIEFNSVGYEHLMESPSDEFLNSESGMEEIIKLRFEREGFNWVKKYKDSKFVISTVAKLVYGKTISPKVSELIALLKCSKGEICEELWHAISVYPNESYKNLLEDEIIKDDLKLNLREALMNAACYKKNVDANPVALLTKFLSKMSNQRKIELIYDLVRVPRFGYGNIIDESMAVNYAVELLKSFDEDLSILGKILLVLMIDENYVKKYRLNSVSLNFSAKEILKELLPFFSIEVEAYFIVVAADAGMDILKQSTKLFQREDQNLQKKVLLSWSLSKSQATLNRIIDQSEHPNYEIRKEVLKSLTERINKGKFNNNAKKCILKMGNDNSASVRLLWTKLMKEFLWPEAICGLIEKLNDAREVDEIELKWSNGIAKFYVARSAGITLRNYRKLDNWVIEKILSLLNTQIPDELLNCALLGILVNKKVSGIDKTMIDLLREHSSYKKIALTAAWCIYERIKCFKRDDNFEIDLDEDIIEIAVKCDPEVAGPTILAIGEYGRKPQSMLIDKLKIQNDTKRGELLRLVRIINNSHQNLKLNRYENALFHYITKNDNSSEKIISEWIKSIDESVYLNKIMLWLVKTKCKFVKLEIEDPRMYFLSKNIPVLP